MFNKSKVLISLLAAALSLCVIFTLWILVFMFSPLVPAKITPIIFTLTPGTSGKTLTNQLHKQNAMPHPSLFRFLIYISGSGKKLQTGEYSIDENTNPLRLLYKFTHGIVTLRSFTVVEGWTFHKMLKSLQDNPYVTHTISNLPDDEIMKLLGNEGEMPEGRFFPTTYKFASNTKDTAILILAYQTMANKLNILWQNRANVPYSCPYKALIAASIIEKETAKTDEKPIIAGVIMRRLQHNMYLQLDPTVIYGLGEKFAGKLTDDDLKRDNAYNTYTRKDLPPTPICLPSESSIYAALHPDQSNILYFVAKGDGTHTFSTTLEEHNQAVSKYLPKTIIPKNSQINQKPKPNIVKQSKNVLHKKLAQHKKIH